jgi:Fe-S cluster assembly scaffold protein SufB
MEELSDYTFGRRVYEDAHGIDLMIAPQSTDSTEEYELCIVQTEDHCRARFEVKPAAYSKSKITIYIYAEGTAAVDCVCTLNVPKDVEGVETDIQIRSWPFDNARIQARPDMFIANSNIVASHGNALGSINAEQQYYLESKGINDYKQLIKESLLYA